MPCIAKTASCFPFSPAAVQLRKPVAAGEIPPIRACALHRGRSLFSGEETVAEFHPAAVKSQIPGRKAGCSMRFLWSP